MSYSCEINKGEYRYMREYLILLVDASNLYR